MPQEQISLFRTQKTDEVKPEPGKDKRTPRLAAKAMPRAVEDGERAEAILKHAFDVFTEAGYAAARMEEIAGRASVAKGLIYFYYKNKESLFDAVLREYVTKPVHTLTLRENPAESMARRLVRFLDLLYANIMDTPFFFQMLRLLLIDGPRFPEAQRGYCMEAMAPVMAEIRECLDEGARRGEWRQEDSGFTRFIIAPVVMLSAWRMVATQHPDLDLRQYVREHQIYALKSLRLSDEAISQAMQAAGTESPSTGKRKRPFRARAGFRRKLYST